MKILISIVCIIFSTFTYVHALECPKAPEQIKRDWEVEVNAAILRIGPVKGAELKTKTKKAAEDLLGKLPDAGKIYLEQMMFSAYCTALRDDKKVTESEKARLLKEYRKDVIPTVRKATAKKKSQKYKPIPQSNQPELKLPRFSEKVDKVIFSLGEQGISTGYAVTDLEKTPREPFYLNGFKPVKIYVRNGMPYADVKIYGGSGFPPIEIMNNQLLNKPPSWDFNSNENALEVVNENHVPMYQFYYKSPSHIVVKGAFPFPGGLLLASKGVIGNPTIPTDFKLDRIFKYPSWKYPGVYDDTNSR